jgi:type IV pilus assembly protein PilV
MTLIEVMVATVVIAVGLLGVAALQVSALQGASNADYRSKAIDFASALSDRMHANLAAFTDSGDTVGLDNAYISQATSINCTSSLAAICAMDPQMTDSTTISTCNPTELAAFDLWEIACDNGVEKSLPGGQLTLTCLDGSTSCNGLSKMLITISWQLQSDDNTTEQVIMTVVPGAP